MLALTEHGLFDTKTSLFSFVYSYHLTVMFLHMQICITTSTSAGLEQILPWMFYHKVIGVTSFLLFVEGKAASPDVSKVLESIPVSSLTCIHLLNEF